MSTCYLHGIVPAAARQRTDLPPHVLVAAGPVAGIVTEGPDRLDLADDTIAAVLAHDRLLSGYLSDGPVLPVRFGTAFSSAAAVAAELAADAGTAAMQLAGLAGSAEYGLVVEAPAELPPEQPPEASGGRAFLIQRRNQREAARLRTERRHAALDRLAASAARLARRSAAQSPRPPRLMQLALLMDPAAEAELRAILEDWQAGPHGLPARLDGPFPAYSFCRTQEACPG